MKIIHITKSDKKDKRLKVVMDNGDIYNFGLKLGSTYLEHKDKTKRFNYWARHYGNDKEKNTNFEFSTSNVLWRASLKTLDFIPLATLDYSGGIIITDWYSDEKSNKEQIKIQIRFVSTELRSDSVQVTSYKKICEINNVCTNAKGNESFNREIKDLIVSNARQIKIEESKKK